MASLANILQVLLLLAGLFMMMIILLQRGRGGGLAGAFGGAGGQSAFGTKAGDVFTWITVVTATVWVVLAGIGGCAMRSASTKVENQFQDEAPAVSATTGDEEAEGSDEESGAGSLEIPALETPASDSTETENTSEPTTEAEGTPKATVPATEETPAAESNE